MNYCMSCMQTILETDKECPFCGQPTKVDCLPHHLLPYTVLNKRYMVGKAIGQGGFGITYIGRDMTLNIKVAIKEYFPMGVASRSQTVSNQMLWNSTQVTPEQWRAGCDDFLKEARRMAKIDSLPGIDSRYFVRSEKVYIIYLIDNLIKYILPFLRRFFKALTSILT